MFAWNLCPQTLQDKLPTPAFLSSTQVTDFSWLQKRHEKVVARGSLWELLVSSYSKAEKGGGYVWRKVCTFLGPVGLRDDFLRLPYC